MKRPNNDLVREAVEMLIAAGRTPVVSNGGKYAKVSWVDNCGRRLTLVVSVSPSNHRARVNSRATLRRMLRASGQGACS
jgi:hypothetical protein